jgi:hypothetical protein
MPWTGAVAVSAATPCNSFTTRVSSGSEYSTIRSAGRKAQRVKRGHQESLQETGTREKKTEKVRMHDTDRLLGDAASPSKWLQSMCPY